MHCMKCGTQLPQDANFCYKCGTFVGKTDSNPVKEQWEYCEICHNSDHHWIFDKAQVWLYAEAVSPEKGRYTVMDRSYAVGLKNIDWMS